MTQETEKSLVSEQLFSTPLIRARHPELSKLVQPLKDAILEHKRAQVGIKRSNLGGWHSELGMDRWAGEPAQMLVSMTSSILEDQLDVQQMDGTHIRPGWAVDMWANVNRAGDANAQHCHPGSFASAVFYVDMGASGGEPKDGHFVVEDPRYPMAHMQHPSVLWKGASGAGTESQVAIMPESGELIIFPSWLRHAVRPHSGLGERISIAMNLTLMWQAPGGAR